jgi:hypothetical protein
MRGFERSRLDQGMPAERVKRWSVEVGEWEVCEGRERGLGERGKRSEVGTSGLLLEQGTRHTMGEGSRRKGTGKLGGRDQPKKKGKVRKSPKVRNSTDREFSLNFPFGTEEYRVESRRFRHAARVIGRWMGDPVEDWQWIGPHGSGRMRSGPDTVHVHPVWSRRFPKITTEYL